MKYKGLSIHEKVLIGCLFFNPLFLPFGLFYSHLYSPIGFYYLSKKSKNASLFIFMLMGLFLVYTALLFITSIDAIKIADYITSTIIFFASVIFAVYIYVYIALCMVDFENFIDKVALINFIFCIFAVVLLAANITNPLWITEELGGGRIRLQMFCYEPSIYALSFAPISIYAYLRFIRNQSRHNLFYAIIVSIPLALSASAGVIGATGIALLLSHAKFLFRFMVKRWWYTLAITLLLVVFSPNIIDRFQSILDGDDFSGQVRVVLSIQVAIDMLTDKGNWMLGPGMGQLKLLIEQYTNNYDGFIGSNTLPNSIASTIGTVGIIGLVLKLLIPFWLYVITRSYNFHYSKVMFVFIFIYQFTGGFFSNVNEFLALAFAFGYARYNQRIEGQQTAWQSKQN